MAKMRGEVNEIEERKTTEKNQQDKGLVQQNWHPSKTNNRKKIKHKLLISGRKQDITTDSAYIKRIIGNTEQTPTYTYNKQSELYT